MSTRITTKSRPILTASTKLAHEILFALYEKQLMLSLPGPAVSAAGADDHVLFLRHLHRLSAPLRHWRCGLQLDREPHRRDHARFAAAGDAVLIVPEADERSGAVAVQADRMRVHRAGDAFRLHARQHRSENLVAGAARADFFHGNVLHRVRVGERLLEPRGGIALARTQ